MGSIVCPLDQRFSGEITALLQPLAPQQVQEYFDGIIKSRKCYGLRVKQDGEFGKGVYAEVKFKEDDLVLKDQMLVGAQHSSNKIDCLVCSSCFCFIGTIELQIGRKLYLEGLGVSSNGGCQSDSSDDEGGSCMVDHEGGVGCSTSSSREKILLPTEVVQSLMNGETKLPYSEKFSLLSIVPCPGGCGEVYYCSKTCAEMDWQYCHSLLCTGERSLSSCRQSLSIFMNHANDTNDIFILASKVVSSTILRYRKLKAAHLEGMDPAIRNGEEFIGRSLLLEAWRPISVGYKRRWWDCIALPADVDQCDEVAFRLQIKELAFTSLQLLKEAIYDEDCGPLFSLEIYGQIIGMFELNNLDLVVASPVEDYFLYIDDLPKCQKKEAEKSTKAVLDALGDDYSVCCEGTAFYPLQSCMNHSCSPNAKAFKREEDRDGQATIVAIRPIEVGEEVMISYIDEVLPYEERQALLADYGFRCKCLKCLKKESCTNEE